jgi:hypothetical protein
MTSYFTSDRKITILNSQLFSFPVLLNGITVSRRFLPDTPSGDGGTVPVPLALPTALYGSKYELWHKGKKAD